MPNEQNHNFKKLLDSCSGNTIELKKELAAYSGLTWRYIHMLYKGDQKTITINNAIVFLEFFNQKRDKSLPKLELEDLFEQREWVADELAKSDIEIR